MEGTHEFAKSAEAKCCSNEVGIYDSILGLYRDNGKEHGNYYSILGLYRDNGKENGAYYSIGVVG